MNSILGGKIKSLRESKGFTQEQVSEKMNCSRQKYARIEKGVQDISYASLVNIADVLDVKIEDITSSINNVVQTQPVFRGSNSSDQTKEFKFINKMIDIFFAHKRLYNSVRQVDIGE